MSEHRRTDADERTDAAPREAGAHAPDAEPPNDRREIFGWMMYDWANSAFFTTVVGAMYGPYLTSVA